LKILEAGCGTGQLLAALKPTRGVGVDISPEMIEVARNDHPALTFAVGDIEDAETIAALDGPYDAIVLSDTIGLLEDCQNTLTGLRRLCSAETRLVIVYYNYLWEPLLRFTELLGLRMPVPPTNWLKPADIANLLALSDFERVGEDWRQLLPVRLFGLGTLINRFVATLPFIRRLCLRNYMIARPLKLRQAPPRSVSVVIPCRNERGNIEPILRRLPRFCDDIEILFVEGHPQRGLRLPHRAVSIDSPAVFRAVAGQNLNYRGVSTRRSPGSDRQISARRYRS
jgi:SAM-dependent methyltransferase